MAFDAPLLFIVSGPSGSGKGTLLAHLAQTQPDLERVQTYTTRAMRPTESAEDYNFIADGEFDRHVASGEIFEFTRTYGDHRYGSPKRLVDASDGRDIVVELEVKGMLRLRTLSQRRVVSLFILPESIEELERRIRARHMEDNFEDRIAKAREQVSYAYAYDYLAVNADRERFLSEAEAIVRAERARRDGARFMRGSMSELLRS
jgi:guanylate kinase